MQVFLPYPDVVRSLKSLDPKRLNAMRRESKGVLSMLEQLESGVFKFENQPMVRQFMGYKKFLIYYRHMAQLEWVMRGYKTSYTFDDNPFLSPTDYPNWWGNEAYHQNQQLMLCRKAWQHENQLRGYKDELPSEYDYRKIFGLGSKNESLSLFTSNDFDYFYPPSDHYYKIYPHKFDMSLDDLLSSAKTGSVGFNYYRSTNTPEGVFYGNKRDVDKVVSGKLTIDRLYQVGYDIRV